MFVLEIKPESLARAVSALNSRISLVRIVVVLFWVWGFKVHLCTLVYTGLLDGAVVMMGGDGWTHFTLTWALQLLSLGPYSWEAGNSRAPRAPASLIISSFLVTTTPPPAPLNSWVETGSLLVQ